MDAFGESPKHRKITSHVHRSRRNPCVLKRCVPIVVLLVAATILGVIAGVCLASFNYMHLNDLQGVVVHEDMYQETVREFQAKLSEMTAQISSLNAEVGALSDRLEQVSSNLSTAESALREMVLINRDTITSQNDSLTILGANLRDGLDNSTRRLDDFENLTGLNVANLRNTTEGLGSQIDTLQDTISSDSVDVFGSCTVNQTLPSHLSSDELEPVYTVTTEPVLFNGTNHFIINTMCLLNTRNTSLVENSIKSTSFEVLHNERGVSCRCALLPSLDTNGTHLADERFNATCQMQYTVCSRSQQLFSSV